MPHQFNSFLNEIGRLDRSKFSLTTGLRIAIFVTAPVTLGVLTGQRQFAFASLGALFVEYTEGPGTVSLGVLTVACFCESLAWTLGTLAGTKSTFLVPLAGAGVFLGLLLGGNSKWMQVGRISATTYAVGLCLPGDTISVAFTRGWLTLFGGVWMLAGIALFRLILSRHARSAKKISTPSSKHGTGKAHLPSGVLWHAIVVGVVSAVGLAIGQILGLERDYWIIATILFLLRPNFDSAGSVASMLVGTIAGAVLAAAITTELGEAYSVLVVLLFIFATLMFATNRVSLVLSQFFFVPFLIILIHFNFSGGWQLAVGRIIDVGIGGVLALATVYILTRTGQRNRDPLI